MTPLRQRMLEDMQIRHLASSTQRAYVEHVASFARHFGRSPALLGPEEIRAYQVYLTNDKQLAPASRVITVAALRFFYTVTLQKTWSVEAVIPAPKTPQTLPVVLSPAEVVQFLDCVGAPKHRTILTTCYAAGLRISEAVRLTPLAIDSQRMVLRIEQGKGQKDRYVMLSPTLLTILRDWWRVSRSTPWIFPGDRPGHPITTRAVNRACRKAHRRCGIPKPITPHALTMRLRSISWKPAPTSARFNCCSVIGVSRRRPGISRSPRRRCARPPAPSTCFRAPARLPPPRPPLAERRVDGSPDADGRGRVPPLRRHVS